VTLQFESLPSDLAAAHAMIVAERAARLEAGVQLVDARAEAANAKADLSSTEALISHLKLEIEKLRRQLYGSRSERKARLLEQMELQLEDLEAAATEDELAAEKATDRTQAVQSFQRKRPARKPFPDHLPRERIVIPAPEHCPCCGSTKLSKLGEDITETLEVIPRQWKVIQTVRDKFSCRECETITQPPAPFHVTPRAFAGPHLLAMILFEKFGQHQPLNLSCPWPKSAPSYRRRAAARQRARGRLAVARRRRRSITPRATAGMSTRRGIFTASPASCRQTRTVATMSCTIPPVRRGRSPPHCAGRTPAGSSSSLRTSLRMPGGAKAQPRSRRWRWRRSGALTRCSISSAASTGLPPTNACASGNGAAPLVAALEAWLREERSCLSRAASVAQPIDYMLKRWDDFARFLGDGRICLTNNAAERALRGFALGRKSWLFAGSERGADRAAVMATLIMTAKLNDIDPQAWLADVLARINDHAIHRLDQLLPWNWKPANGPRKLAA